MKTKKYNVNSIMTQSVLSAPPFLSLSSAHDFMIENGMHHLPIMQGSTIVGLISLSDLLLHGQKRNKELFFDEEREVSDIMTKNVFTCSPEDNIAYIASIMIEKKIHCLPVIKKGTLIGIVTTSDLLSMLIDLIDDNSVIIPFNQAERDSPDHQRLDAGGYPANQVSWDIL